MIDLLLIIVMTDRLSKYLFAQLMFSESNEMPFVQGRTIVEVRPMAEVRSFRNDTAVKTEEKQHVVV